MENNNASEVEERVKSLTTRFFKWNQKMLTTAKTLLPMWGLLVVHTKIMNLASSESSVEDDYEVFTFDPALFFARKESAELFFQTKVAPIMSSFSASTLDILKNDTCSYLFGCFNFDPNMFKSMVRLPVIVTDIYLTRQMGEDLRRVGKRKKLSYICDFNDIIDAIMQNVCHKYSIKLLWKNEHTNNKGLIRVCPLVKEKNSLPKTNDFSCAICIDGYKEGEPVMEGPCSHKFHKICLLKWLPKSCPMCRRSCTKVFGI